MNSVQLILSIATNFGRDLHQMDVKSAFIHGDLNEEIYMEKPPRFVTDSSLVCWLNKLLYGLKHEPHAWYEKIDHFFISLGFKCCESDHNIYVLHVYGDTLTVALYVDDLIITRNNVNLILGLKKQLEDTFEMADLVMLQLFLVFKILQMDDVIFIWNECKSFEMD